MASTQDSSAAESTTPQLKKKVRKKATTKKAPAKGADATPAPEQKPAPKAPAKTSPSSSDGASSPNEQAPSKHVNDLRGRKNDGGGQSSGSGSNSGGGSGGNSGGGSGGHSGSNSGGNSGGSSGGGHSGGGGQGGYNDAKRPRKKKRKKSRSSQGAAPGSIPGSVPINTSALPNDDALEREAADMAARVKSPEFKKAMEDAVHIVELQRMAVPALHELAEKEGIENVHKLARAELIFQILRKAGADGKLIISKGSLQITPEGFGFLRSRESSYLEGPNDVYLPPSMVRKGFLRSGMEIEGVVRAPGDNEKFFAMLDILSVQGRDPEVCRTLPIFEDMVPLHPEDRFVLETEPGVLETRIVDLVAPIGRGQRALIVAPPRTGKTVLMQKITKAISTNYPEVKIIVLLIDERPEEVTDFRRNTAPEVEVVASTFDEHAKRHVAVAEMVMEKARRYVEFGEHVVILLDSITRLARAYNSAAPNTGRIMTGGIDSGALTRPKKFFGSARAIENGGSLTILGTALVDTGSKADEVIFEEFKGTGNSELHLDRKLVEKRVYPAIDVAASGTRREELLLDPKELELTYRLRKVLSDMNVVEAMELIKNRLAKTKTNAEFLITMNLG